MAGAGWRDFVPGEVLSAANVQDYLQDQAVMVFASAAARTSALASPTEGMVSFLKDSNRIEAHDGSAWKPIVATTGSILNVHNAKATTTHTASLTNAQWQDFTGLSITLTPASNGSKFLILATCFLAGTGIFNSYVKVRAVRDSTNLEQKNIALSNAGTSDAVPELVYSYLDSPATASNITYKMQGGQDYTAASDTVYFNRSASNLYTSYSNLTIFEIAG